MEGFVAAVEYRRQELLEFVGSRQAQSGVIWGSRRTNALICTTGGRHGRKAGYVDEQLADGSWHYFGQGMTGSQIRQVRDKDCLTEVIFYSTDSPAKLRQIACNQELEGVFFSNREQEQLLPKIRDVFNLTVRKVVDVDNMRGIVMAGVADLDHLITDVLRAVHATKDEEGQGDMCRRLLAKMRPAKKSLSKLVRQGDHASFDEIEKLIDGILELDPSDLDTLLGARLFDSHKRVEMAVSVCKGHTHLGVYKDQISSIKELLQWRNALAHQREIAHESGFPVFNINGKHSSFDPACTLLLRQQLRAQRKTLQSALRAITG